MAFVAILLKQQRNKNNSTNWIVYQDSIAFIQGMYMTVYVTVLVYNEHESTCVKSHRK